MDTDKIRARIRALFSLAGNNPNEHERDAALRKAHDMMLAHGIQELGEGEEGPRILEGDYVSGFYKKEWHLIVAMAVARLYGGRSLVNRDTGQYKWMGMRHQLDACEETFLAICEQIESLYKIALKAYNGSLGRNGRMELRASFKDAAAVRVRQRIDDIIAGRKGQQLVVIETGEAKMREMLAGRKQAKLPKVTQGFGSGAGYNAGGLVRLQKEVK